MFMIHVQLLQLILISPFAKVIVFWLGGRYQKTSGIYIDSILTTLGCDSIIITDLVVNPVYNISQTSSICQGDSLLWEGDYYKTTGNYSIQYSTINGCDSIRNLELIVNPTYNTPQTAVICSGDSVLLGGDYQKVAGIYYDTLNTIKGCDSVITTTLTVNPVYL